MVRKHEDVERVKAGSDRQFIESLKSSMGFQAKAFKRLVPLTLKKRISPFS